MLKISRAGTRWTSGSKDKNGDEWKINNPTQDMRNNFLKIW